MMLRHRNGRGKIFDDSEACPNSVIDQHSELWKSTSVFNSRLEASIIVNSTISNAAIANSFITHTIISGGAIVDCPLVATELVAGGFLCRSEIRGKSRISGGVIEDCHVANVTVYGGKLIGFEWDAHEGYVSRGVWHRPPRQLLFDGLTITESVRDKNGLNLFCGCFEYPADKWLACGDRYGKTLGLTNAEVEEIRQTIYAWQRS